jgi:hypothetical protein
MVARSFKKNGVPNKMDGSEDNLLWGDQKRMKKMKKTMITVMMNHKNLHD